MVCSYNKLCKIRCVFYGIVKWRTTSYYAPKIEHYASLIMLLMWKMPIIPKIMLLILANNELFLDL